jgi:hypothetical protein
MYKPITSVYSPKYPNSLISILIKNKYSNKDYLKHVWKTKDFSAQLDKKLKLSKKSSLLLNYVRLGIIIEILVGIALIYFGAKNKVVGGVPFGIALIVFYPILWSYLILLPITLRRWYQAPSKG